MNTLDVMDYSKVCTKISRFELMMTCFFNTFAKPNLTVGGHVRYPLFSNGTLDSAMQRSMAETARVYLPVDAFVANLCNSLVAFPTGALETIIRSLAEDAAGLATTMTPLKKGPQSRLIMNLVMDQIDNSVVPVNAELRALPTIIGPSSLLTMPWQGRPPIRFFAQLNLVQLQNGRAS